MTKVQGLKCGKWLVNRRTRVRTHTRVPQYMYAIRGTRVRKGHNAMCLQVSFSLIKAYLLWHGMLVIPHRTLREQNHAEHHGLAGEGLGGVITLFKGGPFVLLRRNYWSFQIYFI